MFSAFTAWGMLDFSSKPPRAESIYNALVAAHGGNFDDNFEGPLNADWYATAMELGAARDTLERAENQADPLTVHEMLPVQESMYGLPPGPFDSANTRRATLGARYKVALDQTTTNVSQALRLLLGADFAAWLPVQWPDVWSIAFLSLEGSICKPGSSRIKIIRLLRPVVSTGVSVAVPYEHAHGDPVELQRGEVLVFEPTRVGQLDVIPVQGTPNGWLTGTFACTHEAGSFGTVQPFPYWPTPKKHSLVVVKRGRATDPTLRSKVDDQLWRMLGGTSTWDIVEEGLVPGTTGPLTIGGVGLGVCPFGAFSYPTS